MNNETRTLTRDAELALCFESLGENCEFGFVQRRMGAEPIGLFRFASIPLPQLIRGIGNQFSGIGERVIAVSEGDYVLKDREYDISYHTRIMEGDPAAIVRQQAPRLKFLARKLMEDIADGDKVFVFKHETERHEVMPLLWAMRAIGKAKLLWVTTRGGEPGTVRDLGGGLWRGYIDRFAPWSDTNDLSFDAWQGVCRTAALMMVETAPRVLA